MIIVSEYMVTCVSSICVTLFSAARCSIVQLFMYTIIIILLLIIPCAINVILYW